MSDHRPRRARVRAARVVVEPLEARSLLAAGSIAALGASGVIRGRDQVDAVPIAVDPASFTMPGGRVLLGIAAHPAPRSRLDPGPIRVLSEDGMPAAIARSSRDSAGGRSSLTLAEVGPGTCVALVGAERRTAGAYQVEVFLAGDANGDRRVDEQDLRLISSSIGARAGRRGYRLDLDVDRDGRITRTDLDLARRNLGVSWQPAPALVARLDPESDPNGDLHVLRPTAAVVGRAAPGAVVTLDAGIDGTIDRTTVADPLGSFRIDVALSHGANPLRVATVGPDGAPLAVDLVASRSDVVLDWNDLLLDAIRADRTAPPKAARAMAIVQIAVDDAVNAVLRTHRPYAFAIDTASWIQPEAAAASAAHRALVDLFPGQAAAFDRALAATLDDLPDGPGESWGVQLGRMSSETILAARRDDGADRVLTYPGGPLPGQWRPTPPAQAPAALPQWPFVRPFAMTHPAQFRPTVGPPPIDSRAYAADLDEVRRLGRVDSTDRTADQTQIAHFWADGPGTATPPGHWNQIARDVARQRDTTIGQNARLFALLNVALADAGIASWDAKYVGNVWRPITAIREADRDGNPRTSADPSWTPLIATPPFPSYTSGHSTFSGAGSEILAAFFGPNTAFVTASDDMPGVVRSFTSFAQAADEAGRSRIYGGIHFEFDNRDGLAAGRAVARNTLTRALT